MMVMQLSLEWSDSASTRRSSHRFRLARTHYFGALDHSPNVPESLAIGTYIQASVQLLGSSTRSKAAQYDVNEDTKV